MGDKEVRYTRQMMKPGDRFVLVRTGDRYRVDEDGILFNEDRQRQARLHGNCWVKPIVRSNERIA